MQFPFQSPGISHFLVVHHLPLINSTTPSIPGVFVKSTVSPEVSATLPFFLSLSASFTSYSVIFLVGLLQFHLVFVPFPHKIVHWNIYSIFPISLLFQP